MNKQTLTELINSLMSTGGDFGELFYENTKEKTFNYIDNKLDKVSIDYSKGLGIRLALNNDVYYASTNNLNIDSLKTTINELKSNIDDQVKFIDIELLPLKSYSNKCLISHDKMLDEDKKSLLKEFNDLIRTKSDRIKQVSLNLSEVDNDITIVNHTGLYKRNKKMNTRFTINISFSDGDKTSTSSYSFGNNGGYELINKEEIISKIDELIKLGLDKLNASNCIGKEMPVVIASGFGAVIFHEACGHALEATSVADHLSVLSDKLNKPIASKKVTLIDDGTIEGAWGSNNIDDEGNKTQKNVLIKNGKLTHYLVDTINNRKMNLKVNGCSRRNNYLYPPTSRMSNTYLLPGNDKIEDMIKSIDLGLYCKSLGGGCVSTETGDFNFNVTDAYMIRNGKLAECVKSASLIGNTIDILNNVEMISDDLKLDNGYCGSISGWVPVTIGQPTIKVSKIMVGGENND